MNGQEWEPMYRWERREKLKESAAKRMAPILKRRAKLKKRRENWIFVGYMAAMLISGFVVVAIHNTIDTWRAEQPVRMLSCRSHGELTICGSDSVDPEDEGFWDPSYSASVEAGQPNERVGDKSYSMRDLMGRRI